MSIRIGPFSRSLWLVLLAVTGPMTGFGPISARASELEARVESTLDIFRQRYGFPGATAAYVLADGELGVAATGFADVETSTPMTTQTRMLAASIGKSFVAATVLALAQEGRLALDAPIARWLAERPWFARLPNHDRITLRQLLTHSAGLVDHVDQARFRVKFSRRWPDLGNPFTPEALVQFITDAPPLFEPGEGWAYTDTGYILIGLIIEAATGNDYYSEVTARFLRPLDLTQTVPADRRDLPGLATGYLAADNPFGLPPRTTTPQGALVFHPGFEWTGGGLVSTAADLARWGKALFEGSAMAAPYLNGLLESVPVGDHQGMRYGAGVSLSLTGPFGPVYGHGGWIPGYSSSLRYYPKYKTAIAFQINTDIGIVDDATPLVPALEQRLAELVTATISGSDRRDREHARARPR